MSLFQALSGKISKANHLRKVADEDLAKIKEGLGQEPGDFILGMAGSFTYEAIHELFNPDNNILIKYVNDIDEKDMHSLFCTLFAHFIFRISSEYNSSNLMNLSRIANRLESDLNYTELEFKSFLESEMNWDRNPNNRTSGSSLYSPTVKLIIQYSHADFHSNLDKSIITILLNSYNLTKKEFSSILKG